MISIRRHPALVGAVSVLLLGVYLVASLGVLPSPQAVVGWMGRVAGERYPCEDCGCGCASAVECWTHCCCHSEHERLVWAIENGVMPPAAAHFSEEQWLSAANAVRPGSAHCGACVERIQGELRRGIAVSPTNDRAGEHAGACEGRCGGGCGGTRTAVGEVREQRGSTSCCDAGGSLRKSSWPGPSMSALSCKGLWQLLTIVLPPSAPPSVVVAPLPEQQAPKTERPRDAVHPSRALDVPEPPPRAIAAPG